MSYLKQSKNDTNTEHCMSSTTDARKLNKVILHAQKGVATHLFKMIEDLCVEKKVYSIKVDTNFDNVPMLRILDKLSYTYCGEILFSGAL